MDSNKFAFIFLVLVLVSSTLFVTVQAIQQPYEQTNQPKPSRINADSVSAVLSDKGYHAMSLTLDTILEAVIPTHQFLIHNNTIFTLFCPKDQAFFTSKYPQPPLTLLKYHVVPFKIDKDTFNDPDFGHGSKVDTLLPGHPLVVTSLPAGTSSSFASLNQVKVTEWDLYNDGKLIIHGVDDFFDPAFQTLRYPQYDAKIIEVDSSSSNWLMEEATKNWVLLTSLVAASIAAVLIITFFIFCAKRTQQHHHHQDDLDISYAPLS